MPFDDIALEPEQQALLIELVEATRNVSRDQRESFRALPGDDQLHVFHRGLLRGRRLQQRDIDALWRDGLISSSQHTFDVTSRGFKYYEELKRRAGEPTKRVESAVRDYLAADEFARAYPTAYAKWAEAEAMLWATDTQGQLTAIGHHCREAMQEFATAVVERYGTPGVDADKTNTVSRVRAVLEARKASLGDSERAFLDALLVYWGTVNDLVQRQEHGGQKEGEPLVWEDGRRVVFQTVVVMYEISRSVFQHT